MPTGCGVFAPMGGDIGTGPVPVLQSGESTILEFAWDLPNPADYACAGAEETHFCLLSHIGDPPTGPQNLPALVRGSNDVVWKNVSIMNDTEDTGATSVSGIPEGGTSDLEFTDPEIPGGAGPTFQWGTVEVDLGAGLFARWVEGGMHGDGVEIVDGTVVALEHSGAVLQDIPLQPEDLFTIRVRMAPRTADPTRGGLDIYYLDVTQWVGGSVVGGVRLVRETRFPPRPSPG